MMSLSKEKQSEVIEAFSSTSRYLDYLLNIDNIDGLISQIYPSELQVNRANSSEIEAPLLELHFLCVYFDTKFMINAMILHLRLLTLLT